MTVLHIEGDMYDYKCGITFASIYAYCTGNYETVEAEAENYVPMPSDSHTEESFYIKNVDFKYSDFGISMGYRKTQYYGGVIKGNGQRPHGLKKELIICLLNSFICTFTLSTVYLTGHRK